MATPFQEERIFQGSPVSRGIAFGPAHVSARGFSAPEVYQIEEHEIEISRIEFNLFPAEMKAWSLKHTAWCSMIHLC